MFGCVFKHLNNIFVYFCQIPTEISQDTGVPRKSLPTEEFSLSIINITEVSLYNIQCYLFSTSPFSFSQKMLWLVVRSTVNMSFFSFCYQFGMT